MRNHVYLQVYKMQIIRSLAYKFEVYGNVIIQTIIMLASAFFWKALFQNSSTVKGIDVDTMLTYTVVSSLISIILTTNVERRIEDSVKKGTIAIDLMRPVNMYLIFFTEDLAKVTTLLVQNLIPVFIIGSLFIKLPVPSSLLNFALFLISMVMSFFLNWFIAVMFGIWSFWVINIDAILQVKKHLIRLLSGSIIPIWFFPGWLQAVLNYLPFAYLYQLPLDIYIGKTNVEESVRGLAVQAVWLIAVIAFFLLLKRKVSDKIMIQGG